MYGTFCAAMEQFAIESLRHRERYARKRYMMGAFCDGSIITMERFVLQTIRERYHADVGRLREHFLSASMWTFFFYVNPADYTFCDACYCFVRWSFKKLQKTYQEKLRIFPFLGGFFSWENPPGGDSLLNLVEDG